MFLQCKNTPVSSIGYSGQEIAMEIVIHWYCYRVFELKTLDEVVITVMEVLREDKNLTAAIFHSSRKRSGEQAIYFGWPDCSREGSGTYCSFIYRSARVLPISSNPEESVSVSAGANPLYVVDGESWMRWLFKNYHNSQYPGWNKSNDIEDVNHLKDAQATALYGSREQMDDSHQYKKGKVARQNSGPDVEAGYTNVASVPDAPVPWMLIEWLMLLKKAWGMQCQPVVHWSAINWFWKG